MSVQVGFSSKTLLTDTTLVECFVRVQSFMRNKARSLSKPLLTGATHIRLLTSVHSHVNVQVVIFTKCFFAYSAGVGLLTGTHFRLSSPANALLTGGARMRSVPTQDALAGTGKTPCVARMCGTGAGVSSSLCSNVGAIS